MVSSRGILSLIILWMQPSSPQRRRIIKIPRHPISVIFLAPLGIKILLSYERNVFLIFLEV